MNRNLILLLIICSSSASACNVPKGAYEAITETEYSLEIRLLDNNKFHFVHKNWWAGSNDMAEEHIYKGKWTCTGNSITLKYTAEVITGTYEEQSLAEFGLNKSAKVINFPYDPKNKGIVSGWAYWPKQFVSELFKN